MRNKVFILSLSLIMVLCSSFSVFAATVREVAMTEPSTSDTQGYLVITNPDMSDCNVFYWSIMPYSYSNADNRGSSSSMNLILNDDSIVFSPTVTGSGRVTLTRVYNSSSQTLCLSQSFTTQTSYTYTGIPDIQYYCYSGNIGVVDDNISSSSNYLSVIWGNDTTYQDTFDKVVTRLSSIDSMLADVYVRLGNIDDCVDGLEGRLDVTNDSLSDIYARLGLLGQYVDGLEGQLDDVLDLLIEIESDTSYIYTQLVYVNDKLDELNKTADEIESDTSYIYDRLGYIYNQLESINIKFRTLLESVGEESTEALDDSSIGSLGNDEDAVLSDDSSKLDDLSFSFGNAFDVVWDLISDAWQANSKVFTLVIMCLTVGLIKLILNR